MRMGGGDNVEPAAADVSMLFPVQICSNATTGYLQLYGQIGDKTRLENSILTAWVDFSYRAP